MFSTEMVVFIGGIITIGGIDSIVISDGIISGTTSMLVEQK